MAKEGSVHAALVASDSSARWILINSFPDWERFKQENKKVFIGGAVTSIEGSQTISTMQGERGTKQALNHTITLGPEPLVLIWSNNCCFQCAINRARRLRQGRHVGLVL